MWLQGVHLEQKKLYVYKLSISDEGKISKEYLNTPSLELSQEMTKKLYPYIIENRKLTQFDLLSKKTFEKINNEFKVNFNLVDFELLAWDNNEFGERHLSGALEYILNQRKEKSVKKAFRILSFNKSAHKVSGLVAALTSFVEQCGDMRLRGCCRDRPRWFSPQCRDHSDE